MKKPQLTIQEKILKSNAEFELLTPAEKRVRIAKDVLAQLSLNKQLRKLKIESGVYFTTNFSSPELDEKEEVELQTIAQNPNFKCNVCAKGALFVTKALNYNNCVIDTDLDINSDDILDGLQGIFDEEMLHNIENAFECDVVCNNRDEYNAIVASILYIHVKDDEDRLKLIMENIIDHNGDFYIPKLNELTQIQFDDLCYYADCNGWEFLDDLDKESLLTFIQNRLNTVDTVSLGKIFKVVAGYED